MLSKTSTIPFCYYFSLHLFFFFPLQTWACEWQVSSSALQPSCFCLISCRQVTVSNHPSGSAVARGAQASVPSWSTSPRAQVGCTFLCSLVLTNIVKWERGGEQLILDLWILRGNKLGNILLQISMCLWLLLLCLSSLSTSLVCLFLYFNGILHMISPCSNSYLCKGKHALFSQRVLWSPVYESDTLVQPVWVLEFCFSLLPFKIFFFVFFLMINHNRTCFREAIPFVTFGHFSEA